MRVQLVAIVLGVVLVVYMVVSFLLLLPGVRRSRAIGREAQRDGWRDRARSLPLRERRLLARATTRGEHLEDPRLRALATQRAEHFLTVRTRLDDQHVGVALQRRLFASATIHGVLLVAWSLAQWRATGLTPMLVVAALGALIFLDGLFLVVVLPALYERENRRFRHFLDVNSRPVDGPS
ncbi:MAG TPA: hypothetical protein VF053_14585 [Streptosporangiales bacterium]